jgi:hypothetical protein
MSWDFLVAPVGIGAILLALFAFAWHSLVARGANRSIRGLQSGGEAQAVIANLRSCQILPRKVGRRTERNRICGLKAGERTTRPVVRSTLKAIRQYPESRDSFEGPAATAQ